MAIEAQIQDNMGYGNSHPRVKVQNMMIYRSIKTSSYQSKILSGQNDRESIHAQKVKQKCKTQPIVLETSLE